jgi:hypothetical protein
MWTAFLENSEAISSIFDQEPSLQGVRLMKVQLSEDGPTVDLKVVLPDFPAHPPKRWLPLIANTTILELQLMGAVQLSIAGWTTNNLVDIKFDRSPNGQLKITLRGDGIDAEVVCLGVRVAHLSGCQATTRGGELESRKATLP